MFASLLLLVIALAAVTGRCGDLPKQQPKPFRSKPHVLLLLADDYGWANWGLHNDGSGPNGKQLQTEIQTPNLDRLAKEGVLLDRHYAFRICSPSRSSLMSGRLAMHVNWKNTGHTFRNPEDPVSGSAGIPRNMTGMAAKLRQAGYRTHMVGKWDAGALTPEHTPYGRGFESFFGYHQHANDYWQEGLGFMCTGEIDVCEDKFVDFHMYNDSFKGGVSPEIARELGCDKDTAFNQSGQTSAAPSIDPVGCVNESYCLPDSCYEEAMLKQRALQIIQNHDISSPLFLFFSTHLLHTPLQIPSSYLEKLDEQLKDKGVYTMDSANRRLYAAMTMYLDDSIGAVVDAMKAKDMWDNTLAIFTSDNGGPIYIGGSANNYPLKGGKYSDWEGGIRTNAFISGGFIPPERRGSVHTGVISIADWYGLVCELAGVDQEDKAASSANYWLSKQGLPLLKAVDSVPQWKHILAGTNGRPESLYVSDKAVLKWPYKLVAGDQVYSMWSGQLYPNCSTIESMGTTGPALPLLDEIHLFGELLPLGLPKEKIDAIMDIEHCGDGKLFNVEADPTEQTDISLDPQNAALLKELKANLAEFNKGLFDPDRGKPTMDACWGAMKTGGYYGPYVDTENFYTPVHLTPKQIENNDIAIKDLDYVRNILLPNRSKQIEWFSERVGNLTKLFARGDAFDKCIKPPSVRDTAEISI